MTTSTALLSLQHEIYREGRAAAEPLKQVMPWLVDRRNLEAAWERVASAEGARSPGADGVTVKHVLPHRDRWLTRLFEQLYGEQFQPSAPRWITVPKSDGRTRRLGILNVADRVVHAAIKQVLEPVFDPQFSADSFGFRPGRCVAGALAEATRLLTGDFGRAPPYRYVCKLDVANCFDTVDHQLLWPGIQSRVADPAFLRLAQRVLEVGGETAGWWRWKRRIGLVQGSSLSPLLCNLYLDALDRTLADYAREHGGGVRCLRYADDLLVLARDRRMASSAVGLIQRTLGGLRQRLKGGRPAPTPALQGIPWLGVGIAPRDTQRPDRAEFAYFVPPPQIDAMRQRLVEMTEPPHERIDPATFDLGRWLASLNIQLKGWWQAYLFAENAGHVFRELDALAFGRVRNLLRVVHRGSRSARSAHEVRLPRGFQTWQVNGTRLSVLSSLAPRQPEYLTRRPPWMRAPGRTSRPHRKAAPTLA